MEPLTIVAISGAVGGVAGKFVEKAWDQGEKWLSNYFKDHAPKARDKARENSLDFLAELARRVQTLEKQRGTAAASVVEDSLNHPDFSVLLQKAMISSAQTDNKQKHELLARLVADRLTKEPDSLFSLSCKLACDALPMLNVRHMKILGLLTDLIMVRPVPLVDPSQPKELASVRFQRWLTTRLTVYQDLTFTNIDFLHLESLSCLKWDLIASRSLQETLSFPKEAGITFDYKSFSDSAVGKKVETLWESGLNHALPTTVGQLIGVYVTDMLSGTATSLDTWGEA